MKAASSTCWNVKGNDYLGAQSSMKATWQTENTVPMGESGGRTSRAFQALQPCVRPWGMSRSLDPVHTALEHQCRSRLKWYLFLWVVSLCSHTRNNGGFWKRSRAKSHKQFTHMTCKHQKIKAKWRFVFRFHSPTGEKPLYGGRQRTYLSQL